MLWLMITDFFVNDMNLNKMWFQYDSAFSHTFHNSFKLLEKSLKLAIKIPWFNSTRFFSYIIAQVYSKKPQMLDDLERNIKHTICGIKLNMLSPVMENWFFQMCQYLHSCVGHLHNVFENLMSQMSFNVREEF